MFLFHLAEKLHMTVGQLLKNADSRELSEWQAIYYVRNIEKTRSELDKKALDGINRLKSSK